LLKNDKLILLILLIFCNLQYFQFTLISTILFNFPITGLNEVLNRTLSPVCVPCCSDRLFAEVFKAVFCSSSVPICLQPYATLYGMTDQYSDT